MSNDKKIFVTQPNLPDLQAFVPLLEQIWETRILTNNGPFHQRLEKELSEYLEVPYVSLVNNATIGLLAALKASDLTGEVITTPFTFVATSHSLLWSNLTPVFVDIDPVTMNIDPKKIESAITSRTSAILAVHCYGEPCDVDEIDRIANQHSLKVIYDAAHAFGVRCHCGSLLKHGDFSVLSFHATKVFNTFEGGAVISHSSIDKQRIDRIKNFGIVDENSISEVGLNAKMSELNAALGLLQLQNVDAAIERRKEISSMYNERLKLLQGITLPDKKFTMRYNYSYYPILINSLANKNRDQIYHELTSQNIFARKYFYPLISNLEPYRNDAIKLPVAEQIAQQVLCLPIYPDLHDDDVHYIIQALEKILCG